MFDLQRVQQELRKLLAEFEASDRVSLKSGQIFVIGCSTSEVVGKHIGKGGTLDVAEAIYPILHEFAEQHQLYLAFQGCEHINRAITIEAQAAQAYRLEPVTVVPVKSAGGSMSAYAYTQFQNPVVVETIQGQAQIGIDIGQTLIGMHMKHVAIPVRTSVRQIGEAVVTLATTRPKLIGGERAVYHN